MSHNLPDNKNTGASPDGAAEPVALSAKGVRRRRFGLGASGVILTLASKPGMAAFEEKAHYCGKVSGWHSVTVMSRAVSRVACNGLAANDWARSKNKWPSSVTTTAQFGSVFKGGAGTLYGDSSLYHVVSGIKQAGDDATKQPSIDALMDLRRELVVAHLNFEAKYNDLPTTDQLKAIWENFVLNGMRYHVASTGEFLDQNELKRFLAAAHR